MNPLLLSPESLRAVTRDRLRLLSLCYYISGVISFIISSFLIFHAVIFTAMSFIPASEWEQKPSVQTLQKEAAPAGETPVEQIAKTRKFEPPVLMFRVFGVLAFMAMLGGWTLSAFTIYAGRCISKRKKKTLVYVVAGIQCIFIPYGTVLGIFTFIGLGTLAAKEEYPG